LGTQHILTQLEVTLFHGTTEGRILQ
jgi:hypothetical protein